MMSSSLSSSSSVVETTAGFSAGVAATLVVHPFDILKTRLQCGLLLVLVASFLPSPLTPCFLAPPF